MAITADATTTSLRTATTDPWTFSHAGGGSPVAVTLTAVQGISQNDRWPAGSVTYGGQIMTKRKVESTNLAAGEAGVVAIWDLLSGVPSGTQNVTLDYNAFEDGDAIFSCTTWNAAAALELLDSDQITSALVTNPSLTLQYGGRQGAFVGAVVNGTNSPGVITWSNATIDISQDLGSQSGWCLRQTTPGTSDPTVAATIGANNMAMVLAAYAEVVTANPFIPKAVLL